MSFRQLANLLAPKTIPKIYLGICEQSPGGNSNLNTVWVECADGLFRSPHSPIALKQSDMDEDERNNYLKKIL